MYKSTGMIVLAVSLLILLATCSAPRWGDHNEELSRYVAGSGAGPGPTILPTVTPPPGAALAPGQEDPAAPPLSAVMMPTDWSGPPADAAQRAARMDATLVDLSNQGRFSGAVLVARNGYVLLSQGYGPANREASIPATAKTRFRLASLTKSLTALGVLRLVADDQVRLDASICTYLEPCPPAWQPIQVFHLLHQSSGIPNYTDFADFAAVEQQPATPEQVVARFRDLPLGFAPGSIYHYTNSNYVLLALIIERASGRAYAEYMQDALLTPLGMGDTGVDPGDFSPLGGTLGYAGGALDIPLNVSNLYGAGNLYSTVEDLYRLAQALDRETLLPPELDAEMSNPWPGHYALGWMVEQRGPGRLIYHPGSMSGVASWFGRYPEAGLTVIVLSNDYYTDVFGIADTLTRLALE